MKTTLEGIHSRLDEAEGQISDLEDKVTETPSHNSKKKKRIQKKKNENSLRGFWDNIKCTSIYIKGAPKGEEREQGIENLFE